VGSNGVAGGRKSIEAISRADRGKSIHQPLDTAGKLRVAGIGGHLIDNEFL